MTKTVTVAVQNVPDYAMNSEWWVVRYDAGFLWFWGAYDDQDRAFEVATVENGMVVNNNE